MDFLSLKRRILLVAAAGTFALIGACSKESGEDSNLSLAGGKVAQEGQFPSTVALITPIDFVDTRYCMKEDRHCTMTRIGPRAYLAAGHCFADRHTLDIDKKVVLSSAFQPGKKIKISYGVNIWQFVKGTCPEQTIKGEIAVPADEKKNIRLEATVRKVHFHDSYLLNGAEPGEGPPVSKEGEEPKQTWVRFTHADVAILEVEENLGASGKPFATIATINTNPLSAGTSVIIGGHGMSSGFTGTMSSDLKFAQRFVDGLEGQDFFTAADLQPGGVTYPQIKPGDSGGGVFLASDPTMKTLVGVNSKTIGASGSAHVRLDDNGPQKVGTWLKETLKKIK